MKAHQRVTRETVLGQRPKIASELRWRSAIFEVKNIVLAPNWNFAAIWLELFDNWILEWTALVMQRTSMGRLCIGNDRRENLAELNGLQHWFSWL